jgi:probable rRNA maturation factor
MSYYIDLQHACTDEIPISDIILRKWIKLTLAPFNHSAELTLRFVDEAEMINLNSTYRNLNKTTNVLAFPASYPKEIELKLPLLGDIIICPAVLLQESKKLEVPLISHWAHIVIHGTLHLLGYDHIKEEEEAIMQEIEIKLLKNLGFSNPYETQNEE